MTNQYVIRTRDVDGSGTRSYKTLAGAVKRFEEMVGYSIDNAIAEVYYDGRHVPKADELYNLRAVSNYGTVVTFEAQGDALDRAKAAREAALKAAIVTKAAEPAAPVVAPVAEPAAPALEDCYRCGGSPEVDEDGAFYTCFVCCNTGLLPKAEVDAHYQGEVDYAEQFRPQHLGIFVKKATVYTDSSGESYGDEYAGYDEMERLVCTACDGEGRTKPVWDDTTRDCEPCRGEGETWHQIQRAPGYRMFTGLFAAPRASHAANAAALAAFCCDDDIPF